MILKNVPNRNNRNNKYGKIGSEGRKIFLRASRTIECARWEILSTSRVMFFVSNLAPLAEILCTLLFWGHSMNHVFRTRPATVDEPKSVLIDFARTAESEIIRKASKSDRVTVLDLRNCAKWKVVIFNICCNHFPMIILFMIAIFIYQ